VIFSLFFSFLQFQEPALTFPLLRPHDANLKISFLASETRRGVRLLCIAASPVPFVSDLIAHISPSSPICPDRFCSARSDFFYCSSANLGFFFSHVKNRGVFLGL